MRALVRILEDIIQLFLDLVVKDRVGKLVYIIICIIAAIFIFKLWMRY